MTAEELRIANLIITGQIDLFRLDAYTRQRALLVLEELRNDLRAKLYAVSPRNAREMRAVLTSVDSTIHAYYTRLRDGMGETLTVAARAQANALSLAIGGVAPSEAAMRAMSMNTLVQGATVGDWWNRQAADTAFRFKTLLQSGMQQGKTWAEITRAALGGANSLGLLDVSASNMRALVRTSLQTVAHKAREETYSMNDDIVKGMQQISTLDGSTSDICIAYSGAQWDMEGNPINGTTLPYNGGTPRHWNCRSVIVPIVDSTSVLGFNLRDAFKTRASADGPVDRNLTFNDWLKTRTPAQQDEQLGPGRAQLWRDGKLTLTQLLDMGGNPLTLGDLKQRYRLK